ncbi:Reticulocyte-binding protein 2 like protein a [Dufourea novaeangliae]|uniref:Reticulocyte-binding protein 2 like protein a n=1 Tax=Dufourea novaeangliae TaxID=178035 RepID=A0A154PB16_DUFNO|nr:Reticulocyte-binding protein 2 like protein a [Dufourea novaeangliae]
MADIDGKKLTELRVIDLKTELERRGLDKSGNKAALLERLSNSISDEGENPDEYLIVPCGGVCKVSPRKNSVTGTTNPEEPAETIDNQKKDAIDVSDAIEMKVKVETNVVEKETSPKTEEPQSEVQNNASTETESKQELKVQTNKVSAENTQAVEVKVESEAVTVVNEPTTNASSSIEANGIDNEDSINLTIGEDEENLLAEETESHDRHKDGGEKKKVEENKKGESKGSGRAEAGANSKEGTTSGANAKGDTQQSHMRKRDTANGKSEKKEEKEKVKDNHDVTERKDKEAKKENDEKGTEATKKSDEKSETGGDTKKTEAQEKKEDAAKESDARSTKSTSKKPESERGRRDEKRIRSWDHHRSHTRSRSRERRRRDDVLTFAKIREERERQRLREKGRMLREEERRRREEMERQREIERRQREEAARLEREREKLRRERERIEQEKAELLRLERERQKLEREKLERERLELKRQQMRLEESRRAPPPPSIKRSSSDRRDPRDMYVESDRKRMATEHSRRHSPDRVTDRRSEILDRVSDRRLDTSPPPARYESSRSTQELGLKKEFKRSSDFTSRSSRPESFSDVSRGREVIVRREPLSTTSSSIDPRQVKERYERPSTTTYTREREVRRSEPETHRSSRETHTRYSEGFKPTGSSTPRDSRYVESNRTTSSWHSGPPSTKSFNSVPSSSGTRDPRNEPSSWSSRSSDNVNRWSNSSSMGNTLRHPVPPTYQSGPIQSMGLTAPGTAPSYDRFDPYKSSMPSMRKY